MTRQHQLTALGLFSTSVPRYTSYPTAAQFTPAVAAADYGEWLDRVPRGAAISLYVHVPFCRRLCWFCACRTQGTSTLSPVVAYVETLMREIALVRARLPDGVTLSRLHWGGGTPTLLPAEQITALLGSILDAFPLAPDAEFSIEIDPVEIDDARLDALVQGGLTRASVGVQDFHPEIQKTIGREQSHALTRSVVEGLRQRGIGGLNIDILYGLPFQTEARIRATVDKVLSLQPDRVALYGYAHVPWMSRRQQLIPDDALPSPQARLALFEAAADKFIAKGYRPIGIDHFALPHDGLARAAADGTLRRNFQGYTDDQAPILLGLGASAISRLPQGYAQNAPATADYTRAIRDGHLSAHRGHRLTGEDQLRARMIDMLMCQHAIDLDAIRQDFPGQGHVAADICAHIAESFASFVDQSPGHLRIRPEGAALTRMIARLCDAHASQPARYSAAI